MRVDQLILRRMCAALLCAVLFSTVHVAAQDKSAIAASIKDSNAFILNQRKSTAYRDSVRKSAADYENSLGKHCQDINLDFESVDVRDTLLALVELNDKGVAVAGAWKEGVPGTACNIKRRYNVQVEETPHGERFTAMFSGEAEGDFELQVDALKNIETNFMVLKLMPKKFCHLAVIDTHLVGAPSKFLDNGIMTPWKESWEVDACGKVYIVPLAYTPDSTGTSISVGTSDIHPR